MYVPDHQSPLATLRQLCFEIENDVNTFLTTTKNKSDSFTLSSPSNHNNSNSDISNSINNKVLDQLRNRIVQAVTSRLPEVIKFQQSLKNEIEDLQQERQEWHQKYKKILGLYENAQLANDKMKIEIIALSESYENVIVSYEQLKYKYHELKQKQNDQLQTHNHEVLIQKMEELNKMNKNSSNSNENESQKDNTKNEQELLTVQRELFLDEIKHSQKEILMFRDKIEQLLLQNKQVSEENLQLLQENKELSDELKGEKMRSDKLDREVIELLNKIEDLKLLNAESQEAIINLNANIVGLKEKLQQENQLKLKDKELIEALKIQLTQSKQECLTLKTQKSQQRSNNHKNQDTIRDLKQKNGQLRKQNQKKRNEFQKIINQLQNNKQKMKLQFSQQLQNARNELAKEINRNAEISRQGKKSTAQKLQGICKMHKEITSKLEHKIILLEKDCKEKKERSTQLKYQVERLYQSLQMQVEKEFKSAQKVKELTEINKQLENSLKQATQKLQNYQEKEADWKNNKQELMSDLQKKSRKLKQLTQFHNRLCKLVLPKMKEELLSMRLTCNHFCKMIEMQKQQVNYILQKKEEHFSQLVTQMVMQNAIKNNQQKINFETELAKWKQNCKNYEQKYSKLKQSYEYLSQKAKKREEQFNQSLLSKQSKIDELQQKLEKTEIQQISTFKTIDKLKQKCKEVQKYYKLVQELEKENFRLKDKINQQQGYSYYRNTDTLLNYNKTRHKLTEQLPIRHNKTYNNNSNNRNTPSESNQQAHNDITTKAELQKMRLQAVKRQYEMVSRTEY